MTLPAPPSAALTDTASADTLPAPEATDRETFLAAQREAQKTIERAPLNDVPLSELQGLTLADQFYRVWGNEERGLALWEAWRNTLGGAADTVIEQYAQSTADELGITLNEARARIAVDKVLHDVGPQFATRFMEKYYAEQMQKSRTLKPMAPRKRKK